MDIDSRNKFTNMLIDDKLLSQCAHISDYERSYNYDKELNEETESHIKKIEQIYSINKINQKNINCMQKFQMERMRK